MRTRRCALSSSGSRCRSSTSCSTSRRGGCARRPARPTRTPTSRASCSGFRSSAPTGQPPNAERRSAFERRSNLRGVARGVHLLEDVRDAPIATNEERRPFYAHVRLAVVFLLLPHPVPLGHGVIRVGQQRERQLELLLELRLCGDGVGTHAENDCIQSL